MGRHRYADQPVSSSTVKRFVAHSGGMLARPAHRRDFALLARRAVSSAKGKQDMSLEGDEPPARSLDQAYRAGRREEQVVAPPDRRRHRFRHEHWLFFYGASACSLS